MSPLFKLTAGALIVIGGVAWILSTLLDILVKLIQVIG